jgi:hypothetical protein
MDILSNAFIGRHFEANSHDPHGLLRAYEDGLCARIFEKLWENYPGYNWLIKVNAHPKIGMVTIQLPELMKQTLGWNFKIDLLASDPGMAIVQRGGGELLERYRLTRGKVNAGEYGDAKQAYRDRSHYAAIPGGNPGETAIDKAIRLALAKAANDNALQAALAA